MTVETGAKPKAATNGARPHKLAVIDTDVHHGFKDKADLYPYRSGHQVACHRWAEIEAGAVPSTAILSS